MSVPSGNRQSSRNAKAVMNTINFVLLISYSEWYNSSEGCRPLTGFLYLLKLSMIEANPFNTMPSPVNRIPTAFSRSAISLSLKIRPVPTEIAGTGLLFTSSLPKRPTLWPISAIGSFACEVFFQFFRAPFEPPAFSVWPVVIIDSLPVLSSLHSLQSCRARSSAPAAD